VTGRQPWLWPSEWLLLKGDAAVPPPREDGACPYLDDRGRCSRYEHRPLGCRTFFCARVRGPSAQPVTEMNALLERIERINLNADEDAKVKPLLEWCA
jgi:Fe-S-cluster containining protein